MRSLFIQSRAGSVLSVVLILSCSGRDRDPSEPVGPSDADCPAGPWYADTDGLRGWTHDCEPFSGVHFTVYSDGSSEQAKAVFADLAEEVLSDLCLRFQIESYEDLRFSPGYTYWIYAQRYHEPCLAEGYRNGFLWAAVDRGPPPGVYYRDQSGFTRTVMHELTHVLQFTLTDCPKNSSCPHWLDFWFREGQAIVISGGARIGTLEELQNWLADPVHVNPIGIHGWEDFPDPSRFGEFYPAFGLAYAWLTDETRGYGATMTGIRELFSMMADGEPFTTALQSALDISLVDLEEDFLDLMGLYLSPGS